MHSPFERQSGGQVGGTNGRHTPQFNAVHFMTSTVSLAPVCVVGLCAGSGLTLAEGFVALAGALKVNRALKDINLSGVSPSTTVGVECILVVCRCACLAAVDRVCFSQ